MQQDQHRRSAGPCQRYRPGSEARGNSGPAGYV